MWTRLVLHLFFSSACIPSFSNDGKSYRCHFWKHLWGTPQQVEMSWSKGSTGTLPLFFAARTTCWATCASDATRWNSPTIRLGALTRLSAQTFCYSKHRVWMCCSLCLVFFGFSLWFSCGGMLWSPSDGFASKPSPPPNTTRLCTVLQVIWTTSKGNKIICLLLIVRWRVFGCRWVCCLLKPCFLFDFFSKLCGDSVVPTSDVVYKYRYFHMSIWINTWKFTWFKDTPPLKKRMRPPMLCTAGRTRRCGTDACSQSEGGTFLFHW